MTIHSLDWKPGSAKRKQSAPGQTRRLCFPEVTINGHIRCLVHTREWLLYFHLPKRSAPWEERSGDRYECTLSINLLSSHLYLLDSLSPRLLHQTDTRDVWIYFWRVGSTIISSGDIKRTHTEWHGAVKCYLRPFCFAHNLWRLKPFKPKQGLSAVGRRGKLGFGAFKGLVPHTQTTVGTPNLLWPNKVLRRFTGLRRWRGQNRREDCCLGYRWYIRGWCKCFGCFGGHFWQCFHIFLVTVRWDLEEHFQISTWNLLYVINNQSRIKCFFPHCQTYLRFSGCYFPNSDRPFNSHWWGLKKRYRIINKPCLSFTMLKP